MEKKHPNQPPAQHHRKGVRRELSAGGVAARREGGRWLVALLKTEHKRGKVWVLPKGHVELAQQENLAEAARREVEEEAGLRDLSVKNELGVTRFKFQAETAMVFKTVHYFLMLTSQKILSPQTEEGLLEAKWFSIEDAIAALAYDTDAEIVRRAETVLTGKKRKRPPRSGALRGRPPRIRI